jgi:hypothetical protein
MSIALQQRISVLEETVRNLSARLDSMMKPNGDDKPKVSNPYGPRSLCPKCNLKPAYFLHVKHCKGAKTA